MSRNTATVLMIGDVVGAPGLRALYALLPSLIRRFDADLVIANGENALAGFGIGADEISAMHSYGVQVITTGNHVWERRDAPDLLEREQYVLRPANYPRGLPGRGMVHVQGRHHEWIVINLQGRRELYDIDCPFTAADALLQAAQKQHPHAIPVVDFHAELTQEKEALAWHLDGRVAAVAGTHTHVPTADERILPQGTGYLSDIGMTGPIDSVIGMKVDTCIRRFLTQIPFKMEIAEGDAVLMGAAFTIDVETRRCVAIQRIYETL